MPASRATLPLALGAAVLAVLILADVARRSAAPVAPPGTATPVGAGQAELPAEGPASAAAAAERRALVRRRLATEGRGTYLDSLLATSDSVIRRWAREDNVLQVALVRMPTTAPELVAEAREALGRWGPAPGGLRFVEVADTTAAQLVIGWTDRFAIRRAGQTDLRWDRWGRLARARVTLALETDDGLPLRAEGRLAVALHEIGHALGLPHSADTADVMFEATLAVRPTPRDRASLRLLYDLPVGRVADGPPRRNGS